MSLDIERVDERIGFINATGLPSEDVSPSLRQVASALTQWITTARTPVQGGLLNRNAFVAPSNPLAQMMMARRAIEQDDVVGACADVTEGLIFQGSKWEAESPDDADVFNQVSADLNLDAILRMAYREAFTTSQVVYAAWWAQRTYTVRGYSAVDPAPIANPMDPTANPMNPPASPPPPRRGPRRRKKYTVNVPVQITVLDPCKVIPVGNRLWGGDRLAWHGTVEDIETWDALYDGPTTFDLTMAQLIVGRYVPDRAEAAELSELGVDPTRLLELNPARVWRHTLTKPSYARWPDVRLRTVFRLLDLKSQLMEADRVNLVGAANYILLVKKGSKDEPAYQAEIDNLKENFGVLARLPVIVSDHRLELEIITPKTDFTLDHAKYDVIDRRILARLLGSLALTASDGRANSSASSGRMVSRLLESRRHMIKRDWEANFARAITAANPGAFDTDPNLAFTPRHVQLDADPQITQAVMALRTQRELSRDSILEYFGFDEGVEAQRRTWEEDSGMDAIFGTSIPFSSPVNNAGGMPPGAFGSTGGRPSGGGKPPQNGTTQTGSGN